MKDSTNLLIVLGSVILAIYLVTNKIMNLKERFQISLEKVKKLYGNDIARNVEKIYRLETNHFTSDQFKKTFSAGQEGFSNNYPFGWDNKFWENNPQFKPKKLIVMRENQTGLNKRFIKFPSMDAAVLTLADFLQRYNNNAGRWFSTEKDLQDSYIKKLNSINTKYV